MDDETRKMMTEWLGETLVTDCSLPRCNKEPAYNSCFRTSGRCEYLTEKCSRPFTTPDDFFAVKNRLVELGLWVEFYMWAWNDWFETGPEWWSARFANWLIDPARCQLVADFLKGRE